MNVSVVEQRGEPPNVMNVGTALSFLPEDEDLFDVAIRLMNGEPIRVRRHGKQVILNEFRTLPDESQLPLPNLPAIREYSWIGDCTVHLELDVRALCKAPSEKLALEQIEDTVRCLVTPRPDFALQVVQEDLEALLLRIDHMRTPQDLAAAHIHIHKVEQVPQHTLEDQT